ncbi:serine/threonine protein kinase [Nocardiopsis terrae]|uniref:non-specific serine/threonine protein kinase n=1 Tax=Nocardiopsis terrae TaxID=372655 RepID=A0ABR9HDL2_9ACTN|nr:class III lanthionine synthetase LanKC [Nocardiopsis terrae]MBE1456885.1 putative Ser/Thr protein kinase [Nocardiopsis terrae]GHC74609.1 serine/threonine protein kinase [Nocardiopsis terrae]
MIKGYGVFCDADHYFYDTPHRLWSGSGASGTVGERDRVFGTAERPVPEGWQSHRAGDWLALRPVEHHLPDQGWKIHVSACLDNAEAILARVWDYCVPRGVSFKFVPTRYLLHNRNAKYADRGGSGKFITVYPADEDECASVAAGLDALVGGEPGPYILSDVRWNAGPVHLRYGSFTRRHCYDEHGEPVPALENADGVLVPDQRGPVFRTPEWVTVPDFLRPHLEARSAVDVTGLPYDIERALHFSNGGGVYAGRDRRTGEPVVLKEARPHAGLAADGADAVRRLEQERTALERLSGLGCTPEVKDAFDLGDHRFLVMEYIQGKPLNSYFAHRHPLVEAAPEPERLREYGRWAMRLHGLVEEAIEAVHERGIVFNDLHLFNIMVSEDESSVVLLDFEVARDVEEGGRQTVANPGFVAPRSRRGFDVDLYALACLRIALFLPLTSVLAVDRSKVRHLAEEAARVFPEAREFLELGVAEILRDPDGGTVAGTSPEGAGPAFTGTHGPYPPAEPGDWPHSRDSMVRAILASATPDRDDRYFPGDIAQFTTAGGGLSFGYGAAGVLYALAESGAARSPEAEEWLVRHSKEPVSGTPLGFFDGLSGLSWTLHRLGYEEPSQALAELVLAQPWEGLGPGLHGGTAGIGLALDSLAADTGEAELRSGALRCAELAAHGFLNAPPERRRTGLLHGGAGVALLCLRLYERTGDTALLDLAERTLRADLDRCVTSAFGTLQVDEGWRTMPYLGAGSVGVGIVLDDYLEHRSDDVFERVRPEIVGAARSGFYAQPGLFRGLAGMVLYLSRTTAPGPGTGPAEVRRQIDALSRYAMRYQGHLAFPGEQLMRLSMDLSTGTAGCLLALAAAQSEQPARLPFLPPLRRTQNRPLPWSGTNE